MSGNQDRFYSDDPLTGEELRALRRLLQSQPALDPLIQSYETGGVLWKIGSRVVAWLVGAGVAMTGLILSLKELGWWPGKGPP